MAKTDPAAKSTTQEPLVITISGEHGSGREAVGALLARYLDMPCTDEPELERLVDEGLAAGGNGKTKHDNWLEGMGDWIVEHTTIERPKQRNRLLHLVKVVVEKADHGGILIGAGAHLILANHRVFRLKVEAGNTFCAKALSEAEGTSLKESRREVEETNRARIEKVREIYQAFPTTSTYYDLVLNAESFSREEMVQLTILAMQQTGFLQAQA
ncbi:MAG: cytidylate kinase family protein [Magnetococcales bacterium]|nr:cytidylate kinase family protein [Magnetococcales bacterium]